MNFSQFIFVGVLFGFSYVIVFYVGYAFGLKAAEVMANHAIKRLYDGMSIETKILFRDEVLKHNRVKGALAVWEKGPGS